MPTVILGFGYYSWVLFHSSGGHYTNCWLIVLLFITMHWSMNSATNSSNQIVNSLKEMVSEFSVWDLFWPQEGCPSCHFSWLSLFLVVSCKLATNSCNLGGLCIRSMILPVPSTTTSTGFQRAFSLNSSVLSCKRSWFPWEEIRSYLFCSRLSPRQNFWARALEWGWGQWQASGGTPTAGAQPWVRGGGQ